MTRARTSSGVAPGTVVLKDWHQPPRRGNGRRSGAAQLLATAALAAAMALVAPARAADDQPRPATTPPPGFVSREEYEQLKREQEQMRKDMAEMKAMLQRQTTMPAAPAAQAAPSAPDGSARSAAFQNGASSSKAADAARDDEMDAIERTVREIQRQVHDIKPGTEKLYIGGDAFVGYNSQRNTTSSFTAGLSPFALYRPTDRILVEAAVDLGLNTDSSGNSSTDVSLEIASISYIVNDYLVLGGGKFVAPFANYHRHFDPPWINKLPDDPLVFSDGGLAPGSVVGIFASGALPLSLFGVKEGIWADSKILYDVYASNGPNLVVSDSGAAGQLNFDNNVDLNENKAVGARIAFQPVSHFEAGYSVLSGSSGPAGFPRATFLVQAIDAQYRQDLPAIFGVLDVHGAWVWSHVSKETYDPTGSLKFGPVTFNNNRQGGYVLVAYRPSRVDNPFIKNLEFITRYDWMTSSLLAPGGEHEKRTTFGVDYWLTPSAVIKIAYQFDHRKTAPSQSGFMTQLGLGL